MRVLVIDDEKLLVKGIKFNLENDGYQVTEAYDGEEALRLARENDFDMIILDLMLPKMNGLEVCRSIREFSDVPVIMLTAKGEDMDKLIGFEYGADDYLVKPFNIMELKARIRAIYKRAHRDSEEDRHPKTLHFGRTTISLEERSVRVGGEEVDLTAKEFDLLKLLAENPGKVFDRDSLLDLVWDYDYPGDIRTVDVHIRRLREKIERTPDKPEHILTKWGVGYYFKAERDEK